MIDFYKSPGVRCKEHRSLGFSYCNLCAIELERAENEKLRKEVTSMEDQIAFMDEQIEEMMDEIYHLSDWVAEYE